MIYNKYFVKFIFYSVSCLVSVQSVASIFEKKTDSCVAWQVEKSYLGLYSKKPIGTSCSQEITIKKDKLLYFAEIKVPVSSFKSNEQERDKYVTSTLSSSKHPNIIFTTKKLPRDKWLDLILKGKFEISGHIAIKGNKYKLKTTVTRYHIKNSSFFQGKLSTSFSDIKVDPPSLFLGTVNVKNNINLFYQIDISKIKNIESVIKQKIFSNNDDFYKLQIKDIENNIINLHNLKNHYLLFVNIASRCGYVRQLSELQALHKKYLNKNLKIIAVPSNQFNQEPLDGLKLKNFCKLNYGVDFTILKKSYINGEKRHPLYSYLIKSLPKDKRDDIKWNYEKILVAPGGKAIERFNSSISIKTIEKFLIEKLKKSP
jgi:glutathione peroxidase